MGIVRNSSKLLALAVLALAGIAVPLPALGQTPAVAPGGWIYLDTPVRRGVNCWIGFTASDCSGSRWRSPGLPTESTGNLIRGTFDPTVPVGVSLDNRAIAWADYEFDLQGASGFVNTSIAVKYDLTTALVGGAAYAANTLLTMTVTDITDPNEAYLASLTLSDNNRQGDQGITDVSVGKETHISTDNVGKLDVTLPRGRRYRVRLTAQGSGSMLIFGTASAVTEATIHYLRVQAGKDVYTQLVTHDTEMKASLAAHDAAAAARLAAHDAAISAQLARHDADIKALLQQLRDGQLEIIRLLLTPEGRRSSTLCPSGPCTFPLK